MKNVYLIFTFSIFLSCNQQEPESSESNVIDTLKANEKEYVPEIVKTSDKNQAPDFFIINVSGTSDIKEAVQQVKALRAKDYPAGYLWIPDYESLSKSELFSVFIGPFSGIDTTIKYLEYYKKVNSNAYAVKVGHNSERTSIMSKFDIRINDKRQFLILTYSTPKDEEEYASNGGEDWGWFTNDVREYFLKHYPDKVKFSSVFYGWLSPDDINTLEKELSLQGFGYVLIKGKNKAFIPHDMPHNIIQSACIYFNLNYIEE